MKALISSELTPSLRVISFCNFLLRFVFHYWQIMLFFSLSAFLIHSFMTGLMHTTHSGHTHTHTPRRLYHHQLRTVVSGALNCFLYSEMENQFAIT